MSQAGTIGTGGGGGGGSITFVANTGTANPSGGILNVLGVDGTETTASLNTINIISSSAFTPNAVSQEFDDFISSNGSDGQKSKLRWFPVQCATTQINGTVNNPGIWELHPDAGAGTDNALLLLVNFSNPNSGVQPINGPYQLGSGSISCNWVISLVNLSNNTNTYRFSIGMADGQSIFNGVTNGTDTFVDGVFFQYSNNLNSGNWTINNVKSSIITTANTNVAATTSFVTLSIVVNAGGTIVAYYINGTQVGVSPLTTNIPTNALSPFIFVHNLAGINTPVNVDLFWINDLLSNPRPGPPSIPNTVNGTLIENYTATPISYQVLGTDAIIGVTNTTAPRTITMPNANLNIAQRWTIKDESLGAATNNITISGNGANIDGSPTFVINTNGGAVDIYWNGTGFFII